MEYFKKMRGTTQSPPRVALSEVFWSWLGAVVGIALVGLLHARLVDQYEVARAAGFTDAELASLARSSIRASFAPDADKRAWEAEIDAWLAAE